MRFKSPDENTDLSNIRELGWDARVGGKPVDVYRLEGFVHTYVNGGPQEYWSCPRGEAPSYKNLIPFCGRACDWGIVVEEHNYFRPGNGFHKDSRNEKGLRCYITRNGEKFYPVQFGRDIGDALAMAQVKIIQLQEHPIGLSHKTWKDDLIGRKVWWYDQPGEIVSLSLWGGSILIRPDGEPFKKPASWGDDDDPIQWDYEDGGSADLLSEHIDWFRK